MERLDPPATVFGEKVTERVATVTWEGGTIKPGEFDEFGMSAKVPNARGRTLVFPALQTYSNGEVVRWIGPPDADEPASRVTLGPKEEEATAAAAQPAKASPPAANAGDGTDESDWLARGLGIAALAAGIAALASAWWWRRKSYAHTL
jgi:uncharacterized protein YcnI